MSRTLVGQSSDRRKRYVGYFSYSFQRPPACATVTPYSEVALKQSDLGPGEAPAKRVRDFFAQNLRILMTGKGWTQSELARQADVARDLISGYINAKTLPTTENAAKLARALDVAVDELLPLQTKDQNSPVLKIEPLSAGIVRARFDAVMSMESAVELMRLSDDWTAQDGEHRDASLNVVRVTVAAPAPQARVNYDFALTYSRAQTLAELFPKWTAD